MMSNAGPLTWVVGLGAALLAGNAEVRRIERRAAEDLKRAVRGDGAKVEVRLKPHGALGYASGDLASVKIVARDFEADRLPIFSEPDADKDGRARRLELNLYNFQLRGLAIEALETTLRDGRFDLKRAKKGSIRLSRSGEGPGVVRIRQQALAAFVTRKFPFLKGIELTLVRGTASIEGDAELLMIRSHFKATGTLVVEGNRALAFKAQSVEFDGKPAEPGAAAALIAAMNPVVDLDRDLRLYGALDLEAIELEDGLLKAAGTIRIPERPAASKIEP